VRASAWHRYGSKRDVPGQGRVRSAAFALGGDHPLARAGERVRTLEKQAGVALATVAAAASATLIGVAIAPIALAASLLVGFALVAALLLAREIRRERAWELIIGGGQELDVQELAQERRRLSEPRSRERLARSLEHALDAALHWHQILIASRPPEGVRLLSRFAPEIREIAARVRAEPADIRGVALLARFLTGGYGSTLYSGDADAIHGELTRIAHLLSPAPRRQRA
jgi:hypothetical protein